MSKWTLAHKNQRRLIHSSTVRNLYSWQEKAIKEWIKNNYRGIISATTGSGKTLVALKAMEVVLQKDEDSKIIILVPTISLLNQWYHVINEAGFLNTITTGRFGSKYSEHLKNHRIMIYVVNSALKYLARHINDCKDEPNLFLIADECHRYGSIKFSQILEPKYKYTLGLSATPERESDYGFEDYLVPAIGPIIFRYSYAEAIADGVISKFEILNYGIELSSEERTEYRRISDKITDLRSALEARYPQILSKKDKYIAELKKYEFKDQDIRQFLNLSIDRKRMLYRNESRIKCVLDLVKLYSNHKIMIFHEDVGSLNKMYEELTANGFSCALIHYKKHKGAFEEFKHNDVRILLSARMFSEGVDLPDVDIGIIAAASSSVRQKIQTIGRIIRKAETKDIARIINLFIKDTTDERVFTKVDWKQILGTANMKTINWSDKKEIQLETVEKRKFRSEEDEHKRITDGTLKPGDIYTARLDGKKYSFDSTWRLFRKIDGRREYAQNQEDLTELIAMVKTIKPKGGSFFINKKGHVILKDKNYNQIYAGFFVLDNIRFPYSNLTCARHPIKESRENLLSKLRKNENKEE